MYSLQNKLDSIRELNILDNIIVEFKLDVIIEILAFLFLELWCLHYFIVRFSVIIFMMVMTIFIMAALAVLGITAKDS